MSTENPRIVIAHWPGLDLFTENDLKQLGELGTLLHPEPLGSWEDSRADELLGKAEVILGHWGCPRLDADMLQRTPNLRLFAYTAGTIKGTVTDEVWAHNVQVTSGADANAEPVAEFTLAAILLANKDVFWQRDLLADAALGDKRQPGEIAVGNWDKTVGVISASLIGRRVIELLKPFPQLEIVLYDPFVTPGEAQALGATKVELDELCGLSHVVSVHAPALPATMGLIGSDQLAAMQTGATLINTARGPIVDHTALIDELESGRLYAILDVTDPEPLPDDNPLRSLPNVFLTPHLAGSQGTELRRMAQYAIDEIRRWTQGEPARNPITRDRLETLA